MYKNKILRFGKYTWSEISAMVADGYIPVANADELDALRNTTAQTMGVGSIWEDTYTTGIDKKYVQINNIDLSGFANWIAIDNFTGTLDGNNLSISNLTQTSGYGGLFSSINSFIGIAKNMILNNFNIDTDNIASTFGRVQNATISNINVFNSYISGYEHVGGLFNVISDNTVVSNCNIYNSTILLKENTTIPIYCGGFASSIALNPATTATTRMVQNCSVINCNISNQASNRGLRRIGGFVGSTIRSVRVHNCYIHLSSVIGRAPNADSSGVGGFVGLHGFVSSSNATNCYSDAIISRSGTINIGGFCGTNTGVITNCYYDTETSGRTDTAKGLPRTTAQMKQGTADSTIGGEAMYTAWDDAIWNFRTNLKYPKIRKK